MNNQPTSLRSTLSKRSTISKPSSALQLPSHLTTRQPSTPFRIPPRKPSDDDFQPNRSTNPRATSLPKNIFPVKRSHPEQIKLPEKKRKHHSTEAHQSLARSLQQTQPTQPTCPFCSDFLTPLTPTLQNALQTLAPPSSLPFNLIQPLPLAQRDAFCRLHQLELKLKPQALRRGYPDRIDFDALPSRIASFDPELRNIIHNKIKSVYRERAQEAYRSLGLVKARSTGAVMLRFEEAMPGYYGPRGAEVILGVLCKLYLETGLLCRSRVSPQLPIEFLQQVLVPEVGYRLIRQDLFQREGRPIPNLNARAKVVMEESRDYGAAMFPLVNQPIEDDVRVTTLSEDEDNNITTLSEDGEHNVTVLSDDEDNIAVLSDDED